MRFALSLSALCAALTAEAAGEPAVVAETGPDAASLLPIGDLGEGPGLRLGGSAGALGFGIAVADQDISHLAGFGPAASGMRWRAPNKTNNTRSDAPAVAQEQSEQHHSLEKPSVARIAVYGTAAGLVEEEIYRLGTSVFDGSVRAGFLHAPKEEMPAELVSGVYLGLSVSDEVSFGLSREDGRAFGKAILPPRFGLGAAIDLGDGRTVAGAVGDMTGPSPSFGVMIGFQF